MEKYDIHMWKNDSRPYLSPLTKVNLKWIKDWNIIPETIRLPEGNTEKTFLDMGLGSNFFYVTPIEKTTKLNWWDYIKLKSVYKMKQSIKWKVAYWVGKNICKPCIW